MHSRLKVLVLLLLVSLFMVIFSGCDALEKEGGTFDVVFVWPEDAKPDFSEEGVTYYAWAYLEEWPDGDETAKIKRFETTTPGEFSTEGTVQLDLNEVPYKDNLIIKVEIRTVKSNLNTDDILYYGRSELFSFSAGEHTTVLVDMDLKATPAVTQGEDGEDGGFQMTTCSVDKSNDPAINLCFEIEGVEETASKVIVANTLKKLELYISEMANLTDSDKEQFQGVKEYTVAELKSGEDYTTAWNINDGLSDSEKTKQGERIIWAKLFNEDGYSSALEDAVILLDNVAPTILSPRVSPEHAKLGDEISVTFAFDEETVKESLTIDWAGVEFEASESDSGSFVYTHIVTSEDTDGEYSFSVTKVSDTGGNESTTAQPIGSVQIDKTPPAFTDPDVKVLDSDGAEKQTARITDKVRVSFKVSEDIVATPTVKVGGNTVPETEITVESGVYICIYTVSSADTTGEKAVEIYFKDLAGNDNAVSKLDDKVTFDLEIPGINGLSVAPSLYAGIGDEITVKFNLSEDGTTVVFDNDGLDGLVKITTTGNREYEYKYTVVENGSEVAGSGQVHDKNYIFSVKVTDGAGNESEANIGEIEIDAVMPTLEDFTIPEGGKIKRGDSYQVELDFSEEIVDLKVLVGPRDISTVDGAGTGTGCVVDETDATKYTCTHIAQSEEIDGVKNVIINMGDKADNRVEKLLEKDGEQVTLEYDVTVPKPNASNIYPESANLNTVIKVTINFSEPLNGDPVINWKGLDGYFAKDEDDSSTTQFVYTYRVDALSPEGSFDIEIESATDLVGNTWLLAGEELADKSNYIQTVKIDKTPPVISGEIVQVLNNLDEVQTDTNVSSADKVKITFSFVEDIEKYTVKIGTLPLEDNECASETDAGTTTVTCIHPNPPQSEGEGEKTVTVELTDLAGNAESYTVGTVDYDMTSPEMVSNTVLPTKVNAASNTVQVKFSFSEAVKLVTLDDNGLGLLNCAIDNAFKLSFTCDKSFDTAITEDYEVKVSVEDEAGNRTSDIVPGIVSVDRELPTLASQSVTPTAVKSLEEYTISFTVSEELNTAPVVKVGVKQLEMCVDANRESCCHQTGLDYECKHKANILGDEPDGIKSISVNLIDTANNNAIISLNDTITYDATPPEIINASTVPSTLANHSDSTILVSFSFSEAVRFDDDDPTNTFKFTAKKLSDSTDISSDFTCSTENKITFSCEKNFLETDTTDDSYIFTVEAADSSGNALLDDTLKTLQIDRLDPVVSWGSIPDIIKIGDTGFTVTFTTDETVNESNPTLWIDEELYIDCTATDGAIRESFTCSFTDLSSVSDGRKTLAIRVADVAGNTVVDDNPNQVLFDRIAPEVSEGTESISPDQVNKNTEEVVLLLGFTEDVENFAGDDIVGIDGFLCTSSDDRNFRCVYTVDPSLTDGNYTLSIPGNASINDVNGNAFTTEKTLGTVTVDRTDPIIYFDSVSPTGVINENHTSLVVTFDAVESDHPTDEVRIRLGATGVEQPCTGSSGHFECTFVLDPINDTISDGSHKIEVEIEDGFGNNQTTGNGPTVTFDRTDPTVISGSVAPTEVNSYDDEITMDFKFSEKVNSIDVNNITVAPDKLPVPLCSNLFGDDQTYRCVYDISSSIGIDDTYSFSVRATDENGNIMDAPEEIANNVEIDRTVINVTSIDEISPLTVTTNSSELKVVFTLDDTPASNPTLFIGNDIETNTPSDVSGLVYTYSITDFSGITNDGDRSVRIELYDDLGNFTNETAAVKVYFDLTRPTVVSNVFGPQAVNKFTSEVTLNLAFSESMTSYAIVSSPDLSAYSDGCTGNTCTWTMPNESTYIDNTYSFTITGTDTNGNAFENSPVSLSSSLSVDRTLPEIDHTGIKICDNGIGSFDTSTWEITCNGGGTHEKAAAKTGSTIAFALVFTTGDPQHEYNDLAMRPLVRIGDVEIRSSVFQEVTDGESDAYAWLYSYTLDGSELNGVEQVFIDIQDTNGNMDSVDALKQVVFDTETSTITNHNITPTLINTVDDIAFVALNFNEPVKIDSATGVVDSSGNMEFICSSGNDFDHYYECVYNITDDTTPPDDNVSGSGYTLAVTGEDEAGNIFTSLSMPEAPFGVKVDVTVPVLNSSSISATEIKGSTSFNILFQMSEPLHAESEISVGPEKIIITTCSSSGTAPVDYVCGHTSPASGSDGIRSISLDGKDIGENPVFANLGSIKYDFTAPDVNSALISRSPVFDYAEDDDGVTTHFSIKDPENDDYVTATVTVYLSEPQKTGVNPVLNIYLNGSFLSNTLFTYSSSSSDLVKKFTYTLDDTTAAGDYTFTVELQDEVNNTATQPVDNGATPTPLNYTMRVDTTEPTKAAIANHKTTYSRVPYGSESTGGMPRYSIVGEEGAILEPDTIKKIIFYDKFGSFVGTTDVASDGSFSVNSINAGNTPVLYMNPVERSGIKISFSPVTVGTDLVVVRNMSWMGTIKGKVPGSTIENPLTVTRRGYFPKHLDLGTSELNQSELEIIGQTAGDSINSYSEMRWIDLYEETQNVYSTVKIYFTPMVYNSVNGRYYSFGGYKYVDAWPAPYTEVFDIFSSFSTESKVFKLINSIGQRPSNLYLHSLINDERYNRMVVFGGAAKAASPNSNMRFYYTDTNRWVLFDPDGAAPTARHSHTMVYNNKTGNYLLWGGSEAEVSPSEYSNNLNDMWLFDTKTSTWSTVTQNGSIPSARRGHSMVYDSHLNQLVLFGGQDGTGALLKDVHLFDLSTLTWSSITASGDDPGTRIWSYMYFDPSTFKIYLYGGYNTANAIDDWYPYNDAVTTLYQFDPIKMSWANMRSHSRYNRSVLDITDSTMMFFDFNSSTDVFTYSRFNTVSLSEDTYTMGTSYPPTRGGFVTAYDEANDYTYLYGGKTGGLVSLKDIWRYDHAANSWKEIIALNPMTAPEISDGDASAAFDSNENAIYLFAEGKLFKYSIASNQWLDIQPHIGDWPTDRSNHSMVYDPVNDKLVLYGGYVDDSTWVWDAGWTEVSASSSTPPVSYLHSLIFNEANNRVMLFGGYQSGTISEDVWEFNAATNTWSEHTSSIGDDIDSRYYHSAAWDSDRNRMIIYGGKNTDASPITLFESRRVSSSSSHWTELEYDYATEVGEVVGHDMVYSPDQKTIFLYGGGQEGGSYNALPYWYALDTGYNDRPVYSISVPTNAIALPENSKIEKLTLKFFAGGRGYTDSGSTIYGAALYMWSEGHWINVATNRDTHTSPGLLYAEITNKQIIDTVLTGKDATLYFAVGSVSTRKAAGNPAQATLDYFEVLVEYDAATDEGDVFKEEDYYISTTASSPGWYDAREKCYEEGMDLVVIDSLEEWEYITTLDGFGDDYYYWIGVHDATGTEDWRTVSGTPFWKGTTTGKALGDSFSYWYSISPRSIPNYNCVLAQNNLEDGRWIDYLCEYAGTRYICEKRRNNKFYISTDSTGETWNDSQDACDTIGGSLISIENGYDQYVIDRSLDGGLDYWIGLYNSSSTTWKWIMDNSTGWIGNADGNAYTYTNWTDGDPDNTNDYAAIRGGDSYQWYEKAGSSTSRYICEFASNDCGLNAQSCAEDGSCCSNQCQDELCVTCKDPGYSCDLAGDCCTNVCNTGSNSCTTCLNTNERSCSNSGDCCSSLDSCSNQRCCRGISTACSDRSECCDDSNQCVDSKCCQPTGEKCKNDSHCCEGVCAGGRCQEEAGGFGDACEEEDQCSSALCIGDPKQCNCMVANLKYQQTRNCCSGMFDGSNCIDETLRALGDGCTTTPECSEGLECFKETCLIQNGYFCEDADQCRSQRCERDVCVAE